MRYRASPNQCKHVGKEANLAKCWVTANKIVSMSPFLLIAQLLSSAGALCMTLAWFTLVRGIFVEPVSSGFFVFSPEANIIVPQVFQLFVHSLTSILIVSASPSRNLLTVVILVSMLWLLFFILKRLLLFSHWWIQKNYLEMHKRTQWSRTGRSQ